MRRGIRRYRIRGWRDVARSGGEESQRKSQKEPAGRPSQLRAGPSALKINRRYGSAASVRDGMRSLGRMWIVLGEAGGNSKERNHVARQRLIVGARLGAQASFSRAAYWRRYATGRRARGCGETSCRGRCGGRTILWRGVRGLGSPSGRVGGGGRFELTSRLAARRSDW
jgi:hypothetical protein